MKATPGHWTEGTRRRRWRQLVAATRELAARRAAFGGHRCAAMTLTLEPAAAGREAAPAAGT